MKDESPSAHRVLLLAGILGAIGIAVGAYTAHGLETYLLEREKRSIPTGTEVTKAEMLEKVERRVGQADVGVRYQLLHCALLIGLAAAAKYYTTRSFRMIVGFITAGIVFFSGSLYMLVLLDMPILGAITPIGGLAFIVGWLCLGLLARKVQQ